MLERGVTTKPPHLSNNSPCEYCGGNHPSFWCCKRHYDHECTQAYAAQQQDAHTHQEANHICSDVSPERILHVRGGSTFIVDSGATSNMTYQSQWLHNYHALKLVYLADATTCQVMGIGDLYIGTFSSTRVLRGIPLS